MFKYNELSIINNELIIDVELKDNEWYEDASISKISVSNHKDYNSQLSEGTYTLYEPETSSVVNEIQPDNGKHVRLRFTESEFSAITDSKYSLNDLLFIYVEAEDISPEVPCYIKNPDIKSVVNTYPFYCKGMNHIKSLSDTCNIPRSFIDYILMYKGLELSLKTQNYTSAIEFFNTLNRKRNISKGGCSCGS